MNSIKIKQRFFQYLVALDRKVIPHEFGLFHSNIRLGKSVIASLPAANAFPFPQTLSLKFRTYSFVTSSTLMAKSFGVLGCIAG
jgi:hypothetical protein